MVTEITMFKWISKAELRELVYLYDINLTALKAALLNRGMPESDWQAVLILKRTGDL